MAIVSVLKVALSVILATETRFSGPVGHPKSLTSFIIIVYSAVLKHSNMSIKVSETKSVHHVIPSSVAVGSR